MTKMIWPEDILLKPDKIPAAAKGTGIDTAKLKAAANGKAKLSAEELARLRTWLKEYKPG